MVCCRRRSSSKDIRSSGVIVMAVGFRRSILAVVILEFLTVEGDVKSQVGARVNNGCSMIMAAGMHVTRGVDIFGARPKFPGYLLHSKARHDKPARSY